jgi:hypothetical protein
VVESCRKLGVPIRQYLADTLPGLADPSIHGWLVTAGWPHPHGLRRQNREVAYPQPAQPVNHGFARTATIDVSESHLLLHEIGPNALWYKKPSKMLLSEITRVDFGGGYEEALHLVGGNPNGKEQFDRASQEDNW